MLKIRTLIIAFAISPLILLNWQLTNQAGTNNSPSKGQAGSGSGGATPPVNYNPSPSKGQAGSGSGGGNNGGNHHPSPSKGQAGSGSGGGNNGSPSKGQAGSGSGSQSDDFTVETKSDGIEVKLSAAARDKLKNVLPIQNNLLSPSATQTLLHSLKLGGLSQHTAGNLVRALKQIFHTPPVTTPHSSLLELTPGKLVASTKTIKPSTKISEQSEWLKVNPQKLNEAIDLYNQIVLESDAETIKQLSSNPEFVTIGQALTELRSVVR
ncbi:MAG: hypothetical protein F6K62_19605 [Sphaerospermopsis sp. SIO1G2]|nr:hypothetical protein [Sphaerospermopsis sp. SIO1G1]NET73052.1 hypothetical protein [Sphaerospermopsis sp. SIO1G2]